MLKGYKLSPRKMEVIFLVKQLVLLINQARSCSLLALGGLLVGSWSLGGSSWLLLSFTGGGLGLTLTSIGVLGSE